MTNITKEERKKWLGASEVASLFGVGFLSLEDLLAIKAGRKEAPDLAENDIVTAGVLFEAPIAEWYKKKSGVELIRESEYTPHEYIKQFGCSLDYFFKTPEGDKIPVEIKFSPFAQDWEIADGEVIKAPLKYSLQLQAQMMCLNAPYGIIAAFAGNKFVSGRFNSSKIVQAAIEKRVVAFWDVVKTGDSIPPAEIPENGFSADLVDMSKNEELVSLCAEYKMLCTQETALQKVKRSVHERIRGLAGSSKIITAKDFVLTQSLVKGGTFERKDYVRLNIKKKGKENDD